MAQILFRNARLFDGWSEELREGCDIWIEDGVVREIADSNLPVRQSDVDVIDCAGRFVMPGMIDAHVHVYAASVNLPRIIHLPKTYTAHFASRFLKACLDRGFTTVRDVGGGDVGLASALRDGLVTGPRFFYGGRIVSQTGGHGDMRMGDSDLPEHGFCACAAHTDIFAIVADGVDAVRWAAREELRRGASHIKIMASGGISSPTDPLDRCQYSDDEIRAVVDEATRMGKYVAAHCHPAESIRRSVELGVRSIEHASIIDDETARIVAEHGAFTVPTLAIMFGLVDEGPRLGFPEVGMQKLHMLTDHLLQGLDTMKRAKVKMGFGTDLVGEMHTRQADEFELRSRVLPPIDILRSACAVNAELIGQEGRLGCLTEGSFGDLLVVDGDPLKDISVLGGVGERLDVIFGQSRFHRRAI